MTRTLLPALAGATVEGSPYGLAVRAAATNASHRVTLPASLKIVVPLTFAVWAYAIGTPTDPAGIAGSTPDNATGDPYACWLVNYNLAGDGGYTFQYNNAGTFGAVAFATGSVVLCKLVHFCVSWRSTVMEAYTDGRLTDTLTTSFTGPNYTATAQLFLGESYADQARISNHVVVDALLLNAALSAGEVAELADPRTRWQHYWQPSRRLYVSAGAAALPSRKLVISQAVKRASYW